MADPLSAEASSSDFRVEYHRGLVEEAVLIASDRQPPARRRLFRQQRDPIYEIADPDERRRRFEELHDRWFLELGLASTLELTLGEQPTIARRTCGALVVPVASRREEFADLARPPGSQELPRLLVRLRVSTLVDSARQLLWLRRELLHIADLLDPEFAFEGGRFTAGRDRALETLHLQRYRVLWEISVAGRMKTRGWLEAGAEQAALSRFRQAFPMLAQASGEQFRRFFRGPRPSHAELVAFATRPSPTPDPRLGSHEGCPLCRMPASRLYPRSQTLSERVLRAIHDDFPDWQPREGLCVQCADLYAALLPGRTGR